MNHLLLVQKIKTSLRVDMSPVIPEYLSGKKLADIKKVKVQSGNKRLRLDSLFEISGNTDHDKIIIRRCSDKLDFIGHAMSRGIINVSGTAGNYLGKDMQGGKIVASGSAGLWTATGMKDGHIEIKKDVGDYLAATAPGNKYGIQGGCILIHGNAGARVGERMRRGIIAIQGNAGDYCGCRMHAGTIMVLGMSGKNVGFNMKRGSIILAKKPTTIPATFNDCGNFEFGFITLILKELSMISRHFKALQISNSIAQRIVGDLAVAGKGELLILDS